MTETPDHRPGAHIKKVYFHESWLQDWVLAFLKASPDLLLSKSEFASDRKKRAIVFWLLHKYAGMTYTDIASRFTQSPSVVHQLSIAARDHTWVDKERVIQSLEPFLPLAQVNGK